MKNFLTKALATGLFTGYMPFAPGTFGTIAGVVLWWFLAPSNNFAQFIFFSVIFLISVPICGKAEKLFGFVDDGRIVLDEVAGYLISVLFLPKTIGVLVAAFIFFRLFDITKPLFIKKLQNLHGGWGIVLDDIAAGIFANIAVRILLLLSII